MLLNSNPNYAALTARLALGTILLSHGLLKLLVFTIAGTVGYFESVGFPAFTAYLTIFGEVAAGTALILGLYSRLAALLSIPILIGAVSVHAVNGWVFSNQGGGWEFPVMLVILAIIVAIGGNGPFAVGKLPLFDALIPASLKK